MGTALLKFQRASDVPPQQPLDASAFAAALSALPEPLAICDGSAVLYANPRFTQLYGTSMTIPENGNFAAQWQTIDFQAEDRRLSLRFLRNETAISGSAHLALMGRMVGGITHDFNNLLTGILLYCDLVQTKFAPSNPLGKKIDEIRRAAEQGTRLIRQLMTIGREDANAPRRVHLNQAITDLKPLLQHMAGEHIQFATKLDESAGAVEMSLAQTEQVVLNLVLNARDAMPGGGLITMETSSRQCESATPGSRIVEFVVSDCGRGMDPKTASRAFEPFFTTKGTGRGTGMGLATVRKIVEEAGGMISVETNLGKGTRMIIRLPEVELGLSPYSPSQAKQSDSAG